MASLKRSGDSFSRSERSTGAMCPAGVSTPSTQVQGKVYIHDACDASGSIASIAARVSGAFHQSCQRSVTPACPSAHASAVGRAVVFPP